MHVFPSEEMLRGYAILSKTCIIIFISKSNTHQMDLELRSSFMMHVLIRFKLELIGIQNSIFLFLAFD